MFAILLEWFVDYIYDLMIYKRSTEEEKKYMETFFVTQNFLNLR